MKTNKSYKKRLKVTKKGKVIARPKGQNHYNAKERGEDRMSKRGTEKVIMTPKSKSRFLSGVTNK
jgi:ribosomal protein L35